MYHINNYNATMRVHLDTSESLAAIADKLTMIGLEVEKIEDKAKAFAPLTVARVLEAADRAMNTGTEVLLQPEPEIDITIESIPSRTEVPAPVVLDQASA